MNRRHRAKKIGGQAWRQCAKKTRYATEFEAEKFTRILMQRRPQTPLRAYDCTYCGGWHITHKPEGSNT